MDSTGRLEALWLLLCHTCFDIILFVCFVGARSLIWMEVRDGKDEISWYTVSIYDKYLRMR